MAERSFIFNADSAAGGVGTINEADWQTMLRRFLATGVIPDSLNELAVTADGSAMSVSLATGDGFVEGFFYRNDAALAKPIAAANATDPRIDTVVLRLDRVANSVVSAVVPGTAAASPVPPTLTQTDSLYELPLADVRVPAAAGVIAAADVTDRRVFSKNLTERDAIAAYLAKSGGTMTGLLTQQQPSKVDRGALPDVQGEVRDTSEEFVTVPNGLALVRRFLRATAGIGHDGVVLQLLRRTDATIQTIIELASGAVVVRGGELAVTDGRIRQRSKGSAVLNLLATAFGVHGTSDGDTSGLLGVCCGTAVVTTDASGGFTVAYPAAFASGVATVVACPGDVAGSLGQVVVTSYSLSGFSGGARTSTGAAVASATIRVNYVAIGS